MTSTIYKDKQGFIWVGTAYGLNQYDGYNFKLFTKEENALQSNANIARMREDEDGRLWLFYKGGPRMMPMRETVDALDIFDPKTEQAVQLEEKTVQLEAQNRQIESDKATIEIQADALKALDKAKTRFFSNITHEFRTPLTLIIGPLEQIISEQPPPTIFRRRLHGVLKNAQHLLGLQKAQALIPDLIISDVMMPKMDGFEVAHAIRGHVSTSHIPLILLTARASLESRLKGLQRGADAYLTKPFSPQELALRIEKLIEIRRLLQERYQNGLQVAEDETC